MFNTAKGGEGSGCNVRTFFILLPIPSKARWRVSFGNDVFEKQISAYEFLRERWTGKVVCQ